MSEHLKEIATQVGPGAHAVLVCDGAGWHQRGERLTIPDNYNRTTFVAGHLRWQNLAEEHHEGAGVLIGLSGEILPSAGVGERNQVQRLNRSLRRASPHGCRAAPARKPFGCRHGPSRRGSSRCGAKVKRRKRTSFARTRARPGRSRGALRCGDGGFSEPQSTPANHMNVSSAIVPSLRTGRHDARRFCTGARSATSYGASVVANPPGTRPLKV